MHVFLFCSEAVAGKFPTAWPPGSHSPGIAPGRGSPPIFHILFDFGSVRKMYRSGVQLSHGPTVWEWCQGGTGHALPIFFLLFERCCQPMTSQGFHSSLWGATCGCLCEEVMPNSARFYPLVLCRLLFPWESSLERMRSSPGRGASHQ